MTIRTLNQHFTFNYMYYSSQHQCMTMIKCEMRRNELGSKMSEACSSYRRVYFRFNEISRMYSSYMLIHSYGHFFCLRFLFQYLNTTNSFATVRVIGAAHRCYCFVEFIQMSESAQDRAKCWLFVYICISIAEFQCG